VTETATGPVASLGSIFVDPNAYADPDGWHQSAAWIRAARPILPVGLPGYPPFWAITTHADVMEVERHPDVFTNAPVTIIVDEKRVEGMRNTEAPVKSIVQMDGNQHTANRAIVNDWFKPGRVRQLEARIGALARYSVDQMASMDGRCDFAQDIAVHYPLRVILSILGLPEEDYGRMLQLTQELFGAEDPDMARVAEVDSQLTVLLDFAAYFSELAASRRAAPTNDLASVIANAEIDGRPLSAMELVGHYVVIATAGHDTTSNAIAGGFLALIDQPDQLALLQARPELIDHAADELIRCVSPVKHFVRTCRERFALRDVTFEAGDLLLLLYASANRDDDVFADPFRLDMQRENASSHLAFGFGRHYCLGAHLARMEMRAIFKELLGRLEHVELDGEPTWVRSHFVQGPKQIPIRYALR
jgi:cytochrome P450